jgi:hypothetical protein
MHVLFRNIFTIRKKLDHFSLKIRVPAGTDLPKRMRAKILHYYLFKIIFLINNLNWFELNFWRAQKYVLIENVYFCVCGFWI